jgi:hypothetical protein
MYLPLLRPRHLAPLPCLNHDSLRCSMLVSHQVRSIHTLELTIYRASSFLIIFIEIPLLLRICPTSSKFDTFMRRFTTNYMRAGIYLAMGIVQWLSIIHEASSLIAAAIMLTLAATFYALAGVKGQSFVGSKTLGGQGVAQMII